MKYILCLCLCSVLAAPAYAQEGGGPIGTTGGATWGIADPIVAAPPHGKVMGLTYPAEGMRESLMCRRLGYPPSRCTTGASPYAVSSQPASPAKPVGPVTLQFKNVNGVGVVVIAGIGHGNSIVIGGTDIPNWMLHAAGVHVSTGSSSGAHSAE